MHVSVGAVGVGGRRRVLLPRPSATLESDVPTPQRVCPTRCLTRATQGQHSQRSEPVHRPGSMCAMRRVRVAAALAATRCVPFRRSATGARARVRVAASNTPASTHRAESTHCTHTRARGKDGITAILYDIYKCKRAQPAHPPGIPCSARREHGRNPSSCSSEGSSRATVPDGF